jgi:YjgF/chorismate_mutase-like, putative endoribonuclease
MNRLLNMIVCSLLGLVVTSSSLFAQTATGAEARLKEANIILPPVPAPVANYVDSVRVGNLLFLAGNTAGADWKFKGKVGKDITVQEGYETARQVGLIMLAKVRAALGSLDRVKRVLGTVIRRKVLETSLLCRSAPGDCSPEVVPEARCTSGAQYLRPRFAIRLFVSTLPMSSPEACRRAIRAALVQ